MKDFSKEYFQRAWGTEGYYEEFSYGVGIDTVCNVGLIPFFSLEKKALEIGPGGGTFTKRMLGNFQHLTAMDVIKMPKAFEEFTDFKYIELNGDRFDCPLPEGSIDFCFAYNVFCHLSNDALKQYLKGIHKALKTGADFIFMLSDWEHTSKFTHNPRKYSLGDLLPMGHFYQDLLTIDIIVDLSEWEVVNKNLLPDHRDILVHIKKI